MIHESRVRFIVSLVFLVFFCLVCGASAAGAETDEALGKIREALGIGKLAAAPHGIVLGGSASLMGTEGQFRLAIDSHGNASPF